MKTLIVYYSMSGNTAYAAERIAARIGADTLRLVPTKEYRNKGLKKFLQGGKSVLLAEKPPLEEYDVDLSRYGHIVFGFPVWAASFAPPLRTFIAAHRGKLRRKQVIAFACQKSSGAEKALKALRKLLRIEAFEVEGVFIEPGRKKAKETDAAIDEFGDALIELGAGTRTGQPLHRRVRAAVRPVSRDKLPTISKDKLPSVSREDVRKYFSNWNYRKHAKFCTALYLSLYAIDMTVSYFICKKMLDKLD